MSKTLTKGRGAVHNNALRQALLHLIEINIPARFHSEREMAEALGILPAHFSLMKNGHKNIGKDIANRIEKGLNLGVGGLYRFQGNTPDSDKLTETTIFLLAICVPMRWKKPWLISHWQVMVPNRTG